jgi:hypothetical protein
LALADQPRDSTDRLICLVGRDSLANPFPLSVTAAALFSHGQCMCLSSAPLLGRTIDVLRKPFGMKIDFQGRHRSYLMNMSMLARTNERSVSVA